MSQRRRRARSAPGRGRNTNFSTTKNIALMSHESESFRDTTDVESSDTQLQKPQTDLMAIQPLCSAFPSPPRIAKTQIERRNTDVEIETEIVPPG